MQYYFDAKNAQYIYIAGQSKETVTILCFARLFTITEVTEVLFQVKVTLRLTYESASPSWRQAPIWDP
jgi:hypothetical protein